ncbi:MAG: Biotin carboxylase of acetyl-CoA carboxylase, partial [uncultured Solirubrobacteraceae bacterium]
ARPHVLQGAGGKSRRDRRSSYALARRAGDRLGGGLLRARRRRAARAPGRRGLPAGTGAGRRVLSPPRPADGRHRALRRRGGPSRLRLPRRERRLRAAAPGGRRGVHRAARRRDRRDGVQDPRPRADGQRRRADRAGHHRAGGEPRSRPRGRRWDRLPDRRQGRRRRWRQGLPRRAVGRRVGGGLRRRRPRGGEVLRRRDGLPRALPARPPPRRGPGARRPPRQRDPPRRARLLHPAPPPEADRGVARADGRPGAARAHRRHRHGRRPRGRLPLGGNHRGPARRRRVLLPRDEHPRAGRALRHRGDDRHRHRARADPRRRRRAAVGRPGGRRPARPRHRVPHQRGGRLQELRARAGAHRGLPRAVRAGRARRLGGRGGLRGDSLLRPDGGQADRLGRRPRARDAADAACARRVRDRRAQDAAAVPPGDPRHRAVGARGDLPRPDRRSQVAQDAGLPEGGQARRRRLRRRARGDSRPGRHAGRL